MQSKLPVLYTKDGCPFGMRAKLAFCVSDVKCNYKDAEKYTECNGQECKRKWKHDKAWMELASGVIVSDSYDIMRYALGVNDPNQWLTCQGIDEWLENLDTLFIKAYRVYLYPSSYEGLTWQKEAETFLTYIESELFKHNGYLDESGQWSFKDALAVPMVYKLSIADEDWWHKLPYPKIHTWLNKFKSSESFRKIVNKDENLSLKN